MSYDLHSYVTLSVESRILTLNDPDVVSHLERIRRIHKFHLKIVTTTMTPPLGTPILSNSQRTKHARKLNNDATRIFSHLKSYMHGPYVGLGVTVLHQANRMNLSSILKLIGVSRPNKRRRRFMKQEQQEHSVNHRVQQVINAVRMIENEPFDPNKN